MPERFKLFYAAHTVELHDLLDVDRPSAKTRRFRFDRDSSLRDDDPNVRILRAMAEAGNAEGRA